MDATPNPPAQQVEARALTISMWGNLFMGAAGVSAAILSNSQAILVDGLFSMIGFLAAILGKRISRTALLGPDKFRPWGYAADEAIFTTFRSLSLLGLVLFALSGAAMAIYSYASGDPPRELNFAPMVTYFVVIGLTCGLLWYFHWNAWRKTGRRSDILRLESKASAFDGLITACAGVGLVGIELLRDGILAPIAPIGDSVIVLILCSTVITRYYKDFMNGLAELAGVSAAPGNIATARRAVRDTLREDGGTLVDLSVLKLGRSFAVTVYYNPGRPVPAAHVDDLTRRMEAAVRSDLAGAVLVLLVSEHGRVLPDGTPAEDAGAP